MYFGESRPITEFWFCHTADSDAGWKVRDEKKNRYMLFFLIATLTFEFIWTKWNQMILPTLIVSVCQKKDD